MRGGKSIGYEFEIRYDSSRPGVGMPEEDQYGYVSGSFFNNRENRPGVVSYRYRKLGGEWTEWLPAGYEGRQFHKDYLKLTQSPLELSVSDAEGIAARFNIYVDTEAAEEAYGTKSALEAKRMILERLARAEDPIEFLRSLHQDGLVAGFSTTSMTERERREAERRGEEPEVIWVRGTINNFLNKLEQLYGKEASNLIFGER
jgi:hypothetical protein